MRIDISLSDLIDENAEAILRQLDTVDSECFSELIHIAQLNPAKDFRHSNLNSINFSGSDLRNFDFTGADLRGTRGRNVTWDATTKMVGALLDGSLFSYTIQRKRFFDENPIWAKELKRRRKSEWADAAIWVADSVREGAPNRGPAIEIAKALIDVSDDNFLKSQVLYFLSYTFDNKQEHFDFLAHCLVLHRANSGLVLSCIRVMSQLFRDSDYFFDILKDIIHEDAPDVIKMEACKALASSSRTLKSISAVAALIAPFSSEARRILVERVSGELGPEFIIATRDPDFQAQLDFVEIITEAKMMRISRNELERKFAARTRFNNASFVDLRRLPYATPDNVRRNAEDVSRRIYILKEKGIPFQITS